METYEQIKAERDSYKAAFLRLSSGIDKLGEDMVISKWNRQWGDFDYMLGTYLRYLGLMEQVSNPMIKFAVMWWVLGGMIPRTK